MWSAAYWSGAAFSRAYWPGATVIINPPKVIERGGGDSRTNREWIIDADDDEILHIIAMIVTSGILE